jgi:hypothetical protein
MLIAAQSREIFTKMVKVNDFDPASGSPAVLKSSSTSQELPGA